MIKFEQQAPESHAIMQEVSTFVIFSSVQFYLAKINYNTRIQIKIVSWQGSPEETRRLMNPGLPSHKEISKVKIRGALCIKNTCSNEKLNKD